MKHNLFKNYLMPQLKYNTVLSCESKVEQNDEQACPVTDISNVNQAICITILNDEKRQNLQ